MAKPKNDEFLDIHKKIKEQKGKIFNNDLIYFSIFLTDEIESHTEKMFETFKLHNIKVNFTDKISDATVVILDAMVFLKLSELKKASTDKKSFDPKNYKFWEEYTEATKLGKRIIDFFDWGISFHEYLACMDERMYSSLCQMMTSNEEDTLKLAASIMCSTNRTDQTTVNYIKEIIKNPNASKLNNNIEFRELIGFIAKVYE